MLTQSAARIACIREVQNSIKDSVHQLISDWIQRLEVGHLFKVTEREIRGPNDSLCIFRGMKDQNAESIKSLEGFQVAWWEEAQTASEKSLRLLRPTMRAEGAEMWFTWNPTKRSDPIDRFLRQDPPKGAVVVNANWRDNPWFTDELEEERQIDLQKLGAEDPMYRHIWEGDYEAVSDMQFISSIIVEQAQQRAADHYIGDEKVMAVDLAWGGSDETVICYRSGFDARTRPWEFLNESDTMLLAGKIAERYYQFQPDMLAVDLGGAGKGVVDRLNQLNVPVMPVDGSVPASSSSLDIKVANKRAECWAKMRMWLNAGGAIPKDPLLAAQLTDLEYDYRPSDNAVLLESKRKLRAEGRPSPDRADALAYSFAFPVMTKALRRIMPETHAQPKSYADATGGNPFAMR